MTRAEAVIARNGVTKQSGVCFATLAKTVFVALTVFVAMAVLGCSRDAGLLHYLRDVPPKTYDAVHKLKELQGETKVDILWVIDNSGSMGSYQQALIQNADLFITDFVTKGGLEWKMGIVSSAINEKPYIGFTPSDQLNHQTANGVQKFKDAVRRLGTFGDATEQFFTPIRKHLDAFPDFVRKPASLTVIFLTDAPDQSRLPAKTLLNYLAGIKGDLRRVIAYGVFAAVDLGCQFTDENWNYAGSGYEEIINATKGKFYKLCDTDFGKNLADLGKDLVSRIKRPYIQLPDRPVVSTLRVIYRGKDLQGGPVDHDGFWIYDFDLNRIVFHSLDFAPGDQEEVTVQYQLADEEPR